MTPVAVVADTTHYLPRSLADMQGIHQVSLYVGWQGELERELEMGGFERFYERLRTDPELPTTSQPSIGDFLAVWEPLIEAGSDIVSIHLASGLSGTCEAARQAHAGPALIRFQAAGALVRRRAFFRALRFALRAAGVVVLEVAVSLVTSPAGASSPALARLKTSLGIPRPPAREDCVSSPEPASFLRV